MKYKKEITFICKYNYQEQIFASIIVEAEKRGYETKLTYNKSEKCEIGFYCEHKNFPKNSKLSFIMLHDSIQSYHAWPDIWYEEPWNNYDIGILPGKLWADMWRESSKYFYTRPRIGVYEIGWPKADVLAEYDIPAIKKEASEKYGIDLNKRSILYAPSYENDNKQDEFVRAMQKLDVNILIKHSVDATDNIDSPVFRHKIKQIEEMRKLHSGLPGVTILNPATNILQAIALSDILVSDESGCMCEAVMMGKPAISVSNWIIPLDPPRYSQENYDFAVKTKKECLSECVQTVLSNYDVYKKKAEEFSKANFKNIGNASKMIMDIVDSAVNGTKIKYPPLEPAPRLEKLSKKRFLIYFYFKVYSYSEKYKFINYLLPLMLKAFLRIKHFGENIYEEDKEGN